MTKVTKPKRKKAGETPPPVGDESVTTRSAVPAEVLQEAMRGGADGESESSVIEAQDRSAPAPSNDADDEHGMDDIETTVNLSGEEMGLPGRDDLDAPTVAVASEVLEEVDHLVVQRKHLRGLVEALVFASDSPIKPRELAKLASAPVKQVNELLGEIRQDYAERGIHLDEVAGGFVFRTSAQYAPFIRDLTKQKPVRLTRAQVETLAIIAYRQPITRPEIDDVRGVDSGPVLKLLLERDLVRILGKRDEPGRPLIYGTTNAFLEFFGLRSLKDLPTLREFTELTDESRAKYEDEMGEPPNEAALATEAEPPEQEEEGVREEAKHESMSVPRSTEPDPVEVGDVSIPIEESEAERDDQTLTSEAPSNMDDDDDDGEQEQQEEERKEDEAL